MEKQKQKSVFYLLIVTKIIQDQKYESTHCSGKGVRTTKSVDSDERLNKTRNNI